MPNLRKTKLVFSKTGVRQFKESKTVNPVTSVIKIAWNGKYFKFIVITWLITTLIPFIYAAFFINSLPDQIPLFYSRLWGETQIANRSYIFWPMVGNVLLGTFNFSFAVSYYEKDHVFSYLLASAACLVSILTLVTCVNIVNLVR